jgi:glycosyltransferase involved in cell wall biosynthesis
MNILFVHQNFPGQFVHLAPALAQRGHAVAALTVETNRQASPVRVARYRLEARNFEPETLRLGTSFAERAHRGEAVARAAHALRKQHGMVPDVVFGHLGWGETLFLKDVWPEARHLGYAEFFYRSRGLDTDFDPEFRHEDLTGRFWVTSRQAPHLQAMNAIDKAISPTRWQASTYPDYLQPRISVMHDGIDTDRVRPGDSASVQLPGVKGRFRRGDEVLTFVNRNLEPYRGYHIFMRALPAVLEARKEAQVVIVGEDGVSYGRKPPGEKSWKQIFLDEVGDRLDRSRVHFVGRVSYPTFVDLMRVSRVHAYLTYPFVLSWSMLEAMSAGCLIVGSRTPPVEEVIDDGVNGRLVDFFDVRAWSDALIEALAQPERLDHLRAAARQTIVERYDLRRQCLPKLLAFVENR